jgi:biotin synthase
MTGFNSIINKTGHSKDEIMRLLTPENAEEERLLFQHACKIKKKYIGDAVYLRGLIELSNICEKNCYYCGIRKGNIHVTRYRMDKKEVLSAARDALEWGYGSVVIQAGETTGEKSVCFIEEIIREIKALSEGLLGITLSLGEQDKEAYCRWFNAGAHRYLLRIETSDPELYKTLHPGDHGFERRIECLMSLKDAGYQLGTGVMIGLPGQTVEQLARDIIFFREIDADMIGMGPYIPHVDTPLGRCVYDHEKVMKQNLCTALRMIAATRIALRDVNITSATALQAIDEKGRERGIMAGANVVMPNLTPVRYGKDYKLYENKPCMDESSSMCRGCLESRITSIGESVGYNQWGDSPHFIRKDKHVSAG